MSPVFGGCLRSCIYRYWLFALSAMLLFFSTQARAHFVGDTVPNCDPSQDIYFDNKLSFEFSSTVRSIAYNNTFVSVHLQWKDYNGFGSASYVFVRRGCPSPNLGSGFVEISVPVRAAFVQQTVTIPKLILLGQRSKIAVVESGSYITSKETLHDIRAGLVQQLPLGTFSGNVMAYNYSKLATFLNGNLPDVMLMGSGQVSASVGWSASMESLRFVDTDAGEASPLGRAELVKLYGLMFGVSKTATAIFDSIVVNYRDAMRIAASAKRRPSVMQGVPYAGFWSIASGASHWSALMRDAGADYRFAQLNSSLPAVSPADYLREFGQAQVWLNALFYSFTGEKQTLDGLIAGNFSLTQGGDARHFSSFLAFQCGNVWSNDNRIDQTISTGNPFFEEGVVRPDLILRDLVTILHPDAFPSNGNSSSLYFYRLVSPLSAARRAQLNLPPCPIVQLAAYPSNSNQVYLTQKYLVRGVSQPVFDQYQYAIVKPIVAKLLQLQQSEFEIFVTSDAAPRTDDLTPAFYFRINIPTSASTSDAMIALAARLRSSGVTTLRSALISIVSAWQTQSSGSYMASAKSSIVASIFTVKNEQELSVMEASAVSLISSDQSVKQAPMPAISATDSISLSKDAIVGIAVGAFIVFALIAAASAWLSYRAGSKHAYEQIAASMPSVDHGNLNDPSQSQGDSEKTDSNGDISDFDVQPRSIQIPSNNPLSASSNVDRQLQQGRIQIELTDI